GENYAVTGACREALGQEVHVLDPFDITNAPMKGRLNPLDLIAAFSTTLEDDAAAIASCLTAGRTFKNDPFWDERAEALMASLIAEQFSEPHDLFKEATLGVVRDNVAAAGEIPRTFEAALEEIRKPSSRPQLLASQFGSDRTRNSILSTASSHLGFLRNGPVRDCLSNSTLAVTDITDGAPMTLYLVLPPDKLRSHGALLRLWLGTVLMAIARRKQAPAVPTLLLVDEAAQLGELEQLRSAITLMRGYGVRVWTFWQDISQLKQIYSRDWQSLLNNSPTQQFFGGTTPSSKAELLDYLTASLRRPLETLKPDELVLVRHGDVEHLKRVNYLTDRALSARARANPFYANRRLAVSPRPCPDNVVKLDPAGR
ncbi:MAG: type IV secretory system conjugative DNA transfer family protein, partial [Rhizobiales bacterium]|nr:type IV secretory system conjugative DNA transfer family protein [Hyphomicrobiales bacterium]